MLESFLHNYSRVAVAGAGPRSDDIVIASADPCRENCSPQKYSELKCGAVLICNLPCDIGIVCKICDAARVTSPARTFLAVMKIEDKFFANGDLGYDNPSCHMVSSYRY